MTPPLLTRLEATYRQQLIPPKHDRPSPGARRGPSNRRLLLFWLWLLVALLGEIGLVLSIAGPALQGLFLDLAADAATMLGLSLGASPSLSVVWLATGSAALLGIGLTGLAIEQRAARSEARSGRTRTLERPFGGIDGDSIRAA